MGGDLFDFLAVKATNQRLASTDLSKRNFDLGLLHFGSGGDGGFLS